MLYAPASHDQALATRGYHALSLVDSASGGSGEKQDLHVIKERLDADENLRIILAGGLDPESVVKTIQLVEGGRKSGVAIVDVSSGVEEDGTGQKSLEKIRKFIIAAKSVARA